MNKLLSFILVYDWECPLSEFSFFDIGSGKPYFAEDETELFGDFYQGKVKSQLEDLINAGQPLSVYFSGPFLEQLVQIDPTIIKNLKSAKHIEMLGGTYHHSLTSLHSKSHFQREAQWHQKLIKKVFSRKTTSFLNTENFYFNDLTVQLADLGFKTTFASAIEWYLGEKQSQRIFHSRSKEDFQLLLVDQDKGDTLFHNPEVTNHFMQFDRRLLEEFGGWKAVLKKTQNIAKPTSLQEQLTKKTSDIYNIRQPISCSYYGTDPDQLRDYPLQKSWLKQLYGLESSIIKKSEALQKQWSQLGSIGVLKKLNPELDENSYDNYQSLINILSDLHLKL